MYVGYYHSHGGFDDDISMAQVAGEDLDEVREWMEDEHDVDDVKWIGSPDGAGSLFTAHHDPSLHITEVEEV